MEKKELVVYGENGQIVECNFERINLGVPSTILGYCDDVKEAISAVLQGTAQMAIEQDSAELDEKTIKEISTFGKSLDESEKEREKGSVEKGIRNFLAKVGIKKFKEAIEKESYSVQYRAYCEKLDKVAEAVELQKQNTLNDIELKNGIINEMMPLIEQLEEMIKVGYIDKAEYDQKTEELKQIADPNNQDQQYEIQFRTQISGLFNNKLNELQKALILYKQQVQSYRLQQNTDMELVMSNESYLKDQAPILKAQGSVMVFNRLQADRIEKQKALDAATNNAISENAKQLQMNAQAAVDLSINGGVKTATIEELDAAIKSGIQIFQNGRKLKQEKNEKERQALQKLNESLNEYQEELLNLVESRQIEVDVAKASSYQKRLGGK